MRIHHYAKLHKEEQHKKNQNIKRFLIAIYNVQDLSDRRESTEEEGSTQSSIQLANEIKDMRDFISII